MTAWREEQTLATAETRQNTLSPNCNVGGSGECFRRGPAKLVSATGRPGGDDQTAAAKAPARRVDDAQVKVLDVLQKKLQGRTLKQQNPHPRGTLAWAGWTIARLGGWTGYASDKSAGPITMRDGLQRFNAIVEGYQLARNVCPS